MNRKFIFGVIASGALLFGAQIAFANPSFFAPFAKTSTATSSPAYLTAGTATSTIVYDSFNLNGTNQSAPSDPLAADTAVLAVQFTASSTASILGIAIERSDDGVDWYQDNLSTFATTSPQASLQVPMTYSWGFSSSTINGVLNTSSRVGKVITVPTPTRYTRAVLTMTGAAGAVWAEWIPKKQNK